ncbi:DUF192 domain-containing protein [Peribacillus sp. NPDC094092]|uniref:DUF192 domain-containing protein n=1 Tax=Peribacillus sp. NPDC094092 TaxID=3390611 RepID=UPI003D052F14
MKNIIKRKMIKILSGNRETRLIVQVADTQRKREKGLMFVGNLPENEGMLFVFSKEIYGGFWMKNTFIPLSIAFLDSVGEILKILDMVPCQEYICPTYDPEIPYHYAIEVNLGWFEKNHIKVGDYVKLG